MVGKFKLRHPDVYSVADVGYMLGGRVGQEFVAIAYWLYMTCVVGSGLLSVRPFCPFVRPRLTFLSLYVDCIFSDRLTAADSA